MVQVEEKLKELGYTLPEVQKPAANYILANRTGKYIYTAGHISKTENGDLIKGKLGADLTIEQGYEAGARCGLSLLATLKQELGDLDKIEKIVKVSGFVNSAPDFYDHPKVINGTSDLFAKVLGERGVHSRSAIGVSALPLNVAVEVEMIVEINEHNI